MRVLGEYLQRSLRAHVQSHVLRSSKVCELVHHKLLPLIRHFRGHQDRGHESPERSDQRPSLDGNQRAQLLKGQTDAMLGLLALDRSNAKLIAELADGVFVAPHLGLDHFVRSRHVAILVRTENAHHLLIRRKRDWQQHLRRRRLLDDFGENVRLLPMRHIDAFNEDHTLNVFVHRDPNLGLLDADCHRVVRSIFVVVARVRLVRSILCRLRRGVRAGLWRLFSLLLPRHPKARVGF
mmetsp:Transcript_10628/g.40027  ORF Transcript_10628/g.40027 Transcript_10628/m.40027 type:complete len:237 (+) Transcript_10628:2220-2930(+)